MGKRKKSPDKFKIAATIISAIGAIGVLLSGIADLIMALK